MRVIGYSIEWRGNENTNKSSRQGNIPKVIVNHIVEGSASSCDSWFRSAGNNVSSAHFLVTKKGEIKQYVKIEDMAWANGLTTAAISNSKAKIVRDMKINPNLYSVSIEHEGVYLETKGELTPEQFKATVWLHEYIREYVQKKWGYLIPIGREHILGHFEIDPVRKPNCPGEKFPFETLIKVLNGGDRMNEVKEVPKWQKDALKALVEKGIIESPEYWEKKLAENITVGEVMGIIAKIVK